MLPLDIQAELFERLIVPISLHGFDRLIAPISLHGCDVWCPVMINLASRQQLRFHKLILKLGKSTLCGLWGTWAVPAEGLAPPPKKKKKREKKEEEFFGLS